MTALDLIRASLRAIGAIASGEVPSADEAMDSLTALNRMLASWNVDRLAIYSLRTDVYTLTAGKQSYTIGIDSTGATTADFNSPRPNKIERATLLIAQATGQVLRNPIQMLDDQQWDRIKLQTIQSTIPTKLYYDDAYPFGNVWLWPGPSATTQLELRTAQKLPAFVNLTDTFDLPDGYEEAITYNLAVRLAPEFGKTLNASIAALALEAKARLESANSPSPLAHCDAGVLGTGQGRSFFNWLTGDTE